MARTPRNLYLRGDTYWGRPKIAGVQYRASLRTTDPREAARLFKAWKKQLVREVMGDHDAPTFKEAVVRWAKEVLPEAVKPAVARRYLASVGQLDPVFGRLRRDQITPKTIAD
ncbi:hypothetical protein [Roseomonas chloroacetimidivorans]|uniref:hypothetical protein n=1 Tax=Roseomonas chloroacetimidivorans TaxID=1766656 RepID=UPI003C78599A